MITIKISNSHGHPRSFEKEPNVCAESTTIMPTQKS